MATFKAAEKTGRKPILDEIAHENREINRLDGEISARSRRIDRLEALLRYCECPKCGAELNGGIMAAEEVAEAAKLIGRLDVPCAFCDTPEEQEAFAKAMDMVAR
jgi:hypothetical protein